MRIPKLPVRGLSGTRVAATITLVVLLALVSSANATAGAVPGERYGGRVKRYDLARDEARGGHTIGRHVGQSDDDLRARLRREKRIRAASTYTDLASAQRVVAETLVQERARIDRWLARDGPRPNLALDYNGDPAHPIGRSLRRGDRRAAPAWDAIVVLKWEAGAGFLVLTSYPEVR